MSRATVVVGVAALSLIVLFLVLNFVNVVSDVMYMVPQGVLVAAFPIGYGMFVDPLMFHGVITDHTPEPPGTDMANRILHIVLLIGSFMGVATYPIWAALVGRTLLRVDRSARDVAR